LRFKRDRVAVVESNVDDATGEVLGRAIDILIQQGAYDVSVSDYRGKKGRVGQTIRVVCGEESVERFARIVVRETGTLGVKTAVYTRLIVPRTETRLPVSIGGRVRKLSFKIADLGDGSIRVKPETAQAERVATESGIPLREVLESASSQARGHVVPRGRHHEKRSKRSEKRG
jgi:uncharacterized protein (DUF111 family)